MPEVKTEQLHCPVCDSADIEQRIGKRKIGDALTGPMEIDEYVCLCRNCGEDGDFAGRNDGIYKDALVELEKRAVAKMIGELAVQGFSDAHVERVLDFKAAKGKQ